MAIFNVAQECTQKSEGLDPKLKQEMFVKH